MNLAKEPSSHCGTSWPMVTKLENYPFEQQSERYFYRAKVKSNWKLYMDAFQEFYHARILHGSSHRPIGRARRTGRVSRRPPTRSRARTGW